MPMQRQLYPPNWDEIALEIKSAANWTCQQCGRKCKTPREDWSQFTQRIVFDRFSVDCAEARLLLDELADKPTRFVLTVAHLDQDPSNNRTENLKALCPPCHLKHDRPFRQHNVMRKREHHGQGNLFELMKLSTRAINSYRRSLKLWMGYVADSHQASNFDVPLVTALGWLIEDSGHMDEFLQRYKVRERDKRRREVRQVVLLWLAEIAV